MKEREEAIQIFEDRILYLREKEESAKERPANLKNSCREMLSDFKKLEFGKYILVQYILQQTYGDIRWCEWVLTLLNAEEINFFNHPF